MGVEVMKRRQEQIDSNPLGNILGMAKTVAPFFGPPGIAVAGGAAIADHLSNSQGEITSDNKQMPISEDPISRRKDALDESPQMQIANSIDSLKYIQDPQQRAELAKPLLQANYLARNKPQV